VLYLFGFALFTLESLISIWVLEVIAYFFIYFILFFFSCLLQFIFMNSSDLAKMKVLASFSRIRTRFAYHCIKEKNLNKHTTRF
jgi:hypothetical protein